MITFMKLCSALAHVYILIQETGSLFCQRGPSWWRSRRGVLNLDRPLLGQQRPLLGKHGSQGCLPLWTLPHRHGCRILGETLSSPKYSL